MNLFQSIENGPNLFSHLLRRFAVEIVDHEGENEMILSHVTGVGDGVEESSTFHSQSVDRRQRVEENRVEPIFLLHDEQNLRQGEGRQPVRTRQTRSVRRRHGERKSFVLSVEQTFRVATKNFARRPTGSLSDRLDENFAVHVQADAKKRFEQFRQGRRAMDVQLDRLLSRRTRTDLSVELDENSFRSQRSRQFIGDGQGRVGHRTSNGEILRHAPIDRSTKKSLVRPVDGEVQRDVGARGHRLNFVDQFQLGRRIRDISDHRCLADLFSGLNFDQKFVFSPIQGGITGAVRLSREERRAESERGVRYPRSSHVHPSTTIDLVVPQLVGSAITPRHRRMPASSIV